MPDYKNGLIYKIYNPDIPEQAYYGSTAHHTPKKRYSRAKIFEKEKPLTRFGDIFTTDNHQFVIIEKYPCECKEELLQREQYYLDNYPDAINLKRAYGRKLYNNKISQKKNKYVLFFEF